MNGLNQGGKKGECRVIPDGELRPVISEAYMIVYERAANAVLGGCKSKAFVPSAGQKPFLFPAR